MLAMLTIIIVTLLLVQAILILTAPTRLVPVAAIRARAYRAEVEARHVAREIKQAQAEAATALRIAEERAAVLALGTRLKSAIEKASAVLESSWGKDTESTLLGLIEQSVELNGFASMPLWDLDSALRYELRSIEISLEMRIEKIRALISSRLKYGAFVAETLAAAKVSGYGKMTIPETMTPMDIDRFLTDMSSLPVEFSLEIDRAKGIVEVSRRASLFSVTGQWIHCIPCCYGERAVESVASTKDLHGEICVSLAGDMPFDRRESALALVFEGTVVDYYNANVSSSPADAIGRRRFRATSNAVDSEGWLVPVGAKLLGVMSSSEKSTKTVDQLLAAGYNVVLSNDTADAARVLSELPEGSHGILAQGRFTSEEYRLADELRPSRHDRPLRY